MKKLLAAALCLAVVHAHAQAPAGAPAGTTGMCNDGTYSSTATKRGACAGHKGVKDWYGDAAAAKAAPAAPAPAPAAAAKASASAPAPVPPAPAAAPAPTKAASSTSAAAPTTPAAGGGAGQVWVNLDSKVYHCSTDRYYGKTKSGQYMTEAAAKQAGARPSQGKACS